MILIGKGTRPNFIEILCHRRLHLLIQIGVLLYKGGGEPVEHPKQVMDNQYLTITMYTGADADGGNTQ